MRKLFVFMLIILALIIIIVSCTQPAPAGSSSDSNDPPPNAPPSRGPSYDEYELIRDIEKSGNAAKEDEVWYYFNAGVDCSYKITYSGDVILSAYHEDKETVFAGNVDDIKSAKNERIYIKVAGKADSNGTGAFSLKYELSKASVPETWTLMIYQNCSSLEEAVMANVKEMIGGYHDNIDINVILLLDKASKYDYGIDGCGFDDTRLFAVKKNGLTRIRGGEEFPEITSTSTYEANMGDAGTLKKFIEFSKNNFPAKNYALIISSHGQAAAGLSGDDLECDRLHPGEISSVLEADQAVNLLVFNACLMGNSEVVYQFRKGVENSGFYADILVASPGFKNISGIDYYGTFGRISKTAAKVGTPNGEDEDVTKGSESIYNPAFMTAKQFSLVLVEEVRDYMYGNLSSFANGDSLNSYDLTKIGAVKAAVDDLAVSLYESKKEDVEGIRNNPDLTTRYYRTVFATEEPRLEELKNFPYYDLKALCEGIDISDSIFTEETRALASAVIGCIDNTIIYSYFGSYLSTDNMYGLSIFFPHGDTLYQNQEMFRYQWWYNSEDVSGKESKEKFKGKLQFCKDGATSGNETVENWFELLDAWYDGGGNGTNGGWNGYQY